MLKEVLTASAAAAGKAQRFLGRLAGSYLAPEPYYLRYEPITHGPKIVHVNGNFIVGGNTQLIVDLIERTSNRYRHQVIVPAHPRPLPYQPVNIKEFSIHQMGALYDHLKNERPDLVHFNYWITPETRFSERDLWFRAVFRICEQLGIPVLQNITIPAEPFLNRAIKHNVFVSQYVADNFNVDPRTPSSVIYPGSDFSHFDGADPQELPGRSIGMVYRLERDKLSAEAIEPFIAAVKKDPGITAYIVGGGTLLNHYRKRVRQEGLEGNFVFTGYASYRELPALYRKMSVFVTPVHTESFGQVTPFAMGMGLAVAGYNVGALSEILGSAETLVKPGNVGALADMIISLVNDERRRIEIGKKNQKRARQIFSVEKMVDEYLKLYDRFIEPTVTHKTQGEGIPANKNAFDIDRAW